MKVGVFSYGWWDRACASLGHDAVALPMAQPASGNPHAADLAARLDNGGALVQALAEQHVDFVLDNGGVGLGFVPGDGGGDDVRLAHEAAGRLLVSHFIDPVVTVFQGLAWPTVWQCLQSVRWVKAVWDLAQARELQAFGIPNVVHVPMAAPNRRYVTDPPDASEIRPVVSFVGNQNTSYFGAQRHVATAKLFPGVLADGVRSDLGDVPFFDVYYSLYGLGAPIGPADDAQARIEKTLAYFDAKLFYNACRCVHHRDRFVILLKRRLGDTFRLIGRGWDTTYGVPCEPSIDTTDAYFDHFRTTAININLVNGNAESGLNMRHFEITAAGGFMLCREHGELAAHFEIGKECAVFRDERDLFDKIQYYLAHPEERRAVALAGQRRTLSEHLYSHRLQTVIHMIEAALTDSGAAGANGDPPDSGTSNSGASASCTANTSSAVPCGAVPTSTPRGAGACWAGAPGAGASATSGSVVAGSVPQEAGLSHAAASALLGGAPAGGASTVVTFSTGRWIDDCRAAVPDADVVLDCGANVGQMAGAFRAMYPNAEIYSFEPVSSVFEQLCARCADLDVHPVRMAVGERDGTATMYLTASPEANSLLAFEAGNPCARWTRVVGEEEVRVCTLDRWCVEQRINPARVDVLKLDVQGAELAALRGARRLLESVRVVYLEVSFVPMYKDCPLFPEVDGFMQQRGYRRHAVYPSDQPQHWGDALYVKVSETADVCTPA